MRARTKWIGATVAGVVVIAAAGTGIAAIGMDDNEQPITGEALQKASAAALAYTGAGRVTETEEGDEDSYYEVEVTMPDGHQVDVQARQVIQRRQQQRRFARGQLTAG